MTTPAAKYALAWEPLAGLLDDGMALLVHEHHVEVGVHKDEMPLDVNWEQYHELERIGILRTLAARVGDRLIGYNSFMIMPHIHYQTTPHAMGDAIFVTAAYRQTGAGIGLIRQAEIDVAEWTKPKRCRIVYHDKAHLEFLGPILRRLDYQHQENIWDKVVGG